MAQWAASVCLLLSSLLLAASNAQAFNPAYPDLTYWEQWALDNAYTISHYVYSEGSTTGQDGEIGNEFVCIRDDVNQVIIGRPDVCGTYYSGLGYSYADITTDPTSLTAAPDIIDNIITENLTDPNLQNWGGCYYSGQNLGGQHAYAPTSTANCGPDIINWSYNGGWVYRRYAIEQALKQAGVNVDGYQWEFRIKNNNGGSSQGGTDTLNIVMYIWDQSGNTVHNKTWTYNWKFDWTTFSGTEIFTSPLIGDTLRDWQIQMYGRDSGYWAGYYGPEMNVPEIRMIYSQNPCAIDPILHPDCEGYVQAYTNYVYDQNCTADPLYDSGCPGYQQAYLNQQCSYDPLYDASCPGYQEAYYDQQCSFNPLYDAGCPGYAKAYFDQQCSIDPFYDTSCPGYAQAYYDQQCGLDALYDSGCPGYAEAYYDQQCTISALYDAGCPGYAEAYYDQQCSLDALYDAGCPGYEEKYFATYVQPGLEQQANQAAGVSSDSTATSTASTASEATDLASDPVAALTQPSATGDSTVDSVLRETTNVSANTGMAGVDTSTQTSGSDMSSDTSTETAQETDSGSTNESTEQELESSLEEGSSNEDAQEESNADESSDESNNDADSEDSKESDGDGDSDSESNDSKSEDKDSDDSKSDKKESKKTLTPAESKRQKLIAIARERATNLATAMSEAASFEAQQAVQRQITALINFVPGFNQYGQVVIPGTDFYQTEEIYQDKKIPENRRGLRNGLAQQLLHEKMVEMQYNNLNKEQ